MDAIGFNALHTNTKSETAGRMTETEQLCLLNDQWLLIYRTYSRCVKYGEDLSNSKIVDQIMRCDHIISKALWHEKCISYRTDYPDKVLQGGIFMCDLGDNLNHEQSRSRPVIVISNTNFSSLNNSSNVLVAPITSQSTDNVLDHEILVTETKYGNIKGKIDLNQIRGLSKSRLAPKPMDRLLLPREYADLFSGQQGNRKTMQEKIKNKLKLIFGIDID